MGEEPLGATRLYKLAIVIRYLRKQRITLFPIAGVAIAVTALVGVMAVADGFEREFTRRLRFVTPDLSVTFGGTRYGIEGGSAEGLAEIIRQFEAIPEVAAVSPVIVDGARVRVWTPVAGSPKGVVQIKHLLMVGVDLERASRVTDFGRRLKYGSRAFETGGADGRPRCIVGARLAGRRSNTAEAGEDWGMLDRGDGIVIARGGFPDTTSTTAIVQDVLNTGSMMADTGTLIVPLDTVRKLTAMPPYSVSSIQIRLKSYSEQSVKAVLERIPAIIEGHVTPMRRANGETVGTLFYSRTWEQELHFIKRDVDALRRVMGVVFFFLYLLSAFIVAAILTMTVLSKVRDIGILRAMGSSARGIAGIYLTYGAAIGVIGTALGLLAALATLHNLDLAHTLFYRVTGWRAPVEMELTSVPWHLSVRTVVEACAASIAVSLAASTIPAVQAARLDPVAAINRK